MARIRKVRYSVSGMGLAVIGLAMFLIGSGIFYFLPPVPQPTPGENLEDYYATLERRRELVTFAGWLITGGFLLFASSVLGMIATLNVESHTTKGKEQAKEMTRNSRPEWEEISFDLKP